MDFYNWKKTRTYDADVTMVIGARGIGKTFGLREIFINDFIKKGYRFAEVTRFKTELSGVSNGYFDRVEKKFSKYIFKTDARNAYIAEKPQNDDKPDWKMCGYFVALSQQQQLKKRTFDTVKNIGFDEAVLDNNDKFHRYLPNEFLQLVNLIDTLTRQRADDGEKKPHIFLLGNACDLLNPYFMHYNIDDIPEFGYSWHGSKNMLLHYVPDSGYSVEKLTGTVAGRMANGTTEASVIGLNKFVNIQDKNFIRKKPAKASFSMGIIYKNNNFGVWIDWKNGYYYITQNIPKGQSPIYALTTNDNKINYITAKRADKIMKKFVEFYSMNLVRFESIGIYERFTKVLALYGVRV